MKKVIFGAMLGAALVYVLDPQLGARRRDRLRELLDRSGQSPHRPADVPVDLLVIDDRAQAVVS